MAYNTTIIHNQYNRRGEKQTSRLPLPLATITGCKKTNAGGSPHLHYMARQVTRERERATKVETKVQNKTLVSNMGLGVVTGDLMA